jgi:hypothetical protein
MNLAINAGFIIPEGPSVNGEVDINVLNNSNINNFNGFAITIGDA